MCIRDSLHMGPFDARPLDVANDLLLRRPYQDAVLSSYLRDFAKPLPPAPLSRVSCFLLHPDTPSCLRNAAGLFLRRLGRSLVYYFPLTLLRLVAALRSPPALRARRLLEWLLLLARLAAFLASFVTLFQFSSCQENRFGPARMAHFTYGGIGCVAALSLFFVPSPSRLEISAWMLPRALQTIHSALLQNGAISTLPNLDVVAFSVSMGVLFMYWQTKPDILSPSVRSILQFLFPK